MSEPRGDIKRQSYSYEIIGKVKGSAPMPYQNDIYVRNARRVEGQHIHTTQHRYMNGYEMRGRSILHQTDIF